MYYILNPYEKEKNIYQWIQKHKGTQISTIATNANYNANENCQCNIIMDMKTLTNSKIFAKKN
jgi:hypothetical protein